MFGENVFKGMQDIVAVSFPERSGREWLDFPYKRGLYLSRSLIFKTKNYAQIYSEAARHLAYRCSKLT